MTKTTTEQEMFAKYHGKTKLEQSEHFWEDAFIHYGDGFTSIAMPLAHNPESVRRIHDSLSCPPGECGLCCRYSVIPLNDYDIRRIIGNTDYSREDLDKLVKVREDGIKYLDGTDGCPMLKDNVCTVYKYRPDVCWLFPVQTPQKAFCGNEPIQQLVIRVKCAESMRIIRQILSDAVVNSGMILLPDLSVIPQYKKDSMVEKPMAKE